MENLHDDQRSQRNTTFFRLFMPWVSMCLLLFFGSCSEQSEEFEVPETLDDAALVEAQLNQLHRTRANDAYSTVLITTAKSVNFQVVKTGRILVDWGDGNQEYDVFSHTYTDNFPAHTICFYDPDTTMTELVCFGTELIFLDLTKSTALRKLDCSFNRLLEIDISKNRDLTEIVCLDNRLSDLDLSQNPDLVLLNCSYNQLSVLDFANNVKLENLECNNNQLTSLHTKNNSKLKNLVCDNNRIKSLDLHNNILLENLHCSYNQLESLNVASNINLKEIACMYNQLNSLDVSNCLLLEKLWCIFNQIADLKISNQSELRYIDCRANPFEKVNNAVLSFIQGLPNRTEKSKGVLRLSTDINESGSLNIVQSFCDIFNWKIELFE